MKAILTRCALFVPILALGCSGPPPLQDCRPDGGLTPVCKFDNPEDLVALGGGWLIVSEMARDGEGGALTAFRVADENRQVIYRGGQEFLPHGIDLSEDGSRLLVVDHGGGESVEEFAVRHDPGAGPILEHTRSIAVPEEFDANLNDVAFTPDGFVATKMFSRNPLTGMLAMVFGGDTGQLLRFTDAAGWSAVADSEGMAPNGVAAGADGRHYFLAEWGRGRVVRVDAEGGGRTESAELGFSPDNLTWTPGGKLLVAGQIASPTDALSCSSVAAGTTCGLGSAIARLDPETMSFDPVLVHAPAVATGAASVALEHEGRIWIGTFAGDRLAWMEAR